MKIVRKTGLAGTYTLQIRKVATDELVSTVGPFKNAITDIGLEQIGTGYAISYGYVGSGNTAATTSDTQMGNLLAYTTSSTTSPQNRTLSSPYWVEQAITFRFPPQGVSLNITEVGVGWGTASIASLWSRTLTVDGGGSPITITLLADEYLDLTYTLRNYPELGDDSYVVNIDSVDHDFVARQAYVTSTAVVNIQFSMVVPLNVTVFGGPAVLGPVTSTIEDATESIYASVAYPRAYVPTSKKLVYDVAMGPTSGNVTGGITGFQFSPAGAGLLPSATQITVDPAIDKDATKSLDITIEQSWDRV